MRNAFKLSAAAGSDPQLPFFIYPVDRTPVFLRWSATRRFLLGDLPIFQSLIHLRLGKIHITQLRFGSTDPLVDHRQHMDFPQPRSLRERNLQHIARLNR